MSFVRISFMIVCAAAIGACQQNEASLDAQGAQQYAKEISPQGFESNRLDQIKQMLQSEIDQRHIGSAVGLIARNGEIVFLEALGEADPDAPMFDDAIVRLASVGKGFTAVTTLILYERGLISLRDPVSKYLPAFKDLKIAKEKENGDPVDLVSPMRQVTIRDLLTHTSGLAVTGNAFEKVWADTESGNSDATTRDLADGIAQIPMTFQPGEKFQYGYYGSNYEVLAAVLEVASGKTLEALFDENLFTPLGMKDSHFWIPEEKLSRHPAIYRMRNSELELIQRMGQENPRTSFLSGGGGVRSTARDLYRFGQMLLNGGELDGVRIISPKTVELMTKNHVGDLLPWGKGEFGWGFGVEVRRRVRDYDIGSVGAYGWNGGSGAQYWVDPQEQIVAVLFTPYAPPTHSEVFALFERGVYSAISTSYTD